MSFAGRNKNGRGQRPAAGALPLLAAVLTLSSGFGPALAQEDLLEKLGIDPQIREQRGQEQGPRDVAADAGDQTPQPETSQPPPPAPADGETLSAFERQLESYVDPLVGRPVRQFGYEVFGRLQPAPSEIPVGDDYLLGTGDSVVVSLWGSVDQDYRVTIDRAGEVRLPLIGPVPLKGLTLGRVREDLKRRFDQQYKNYELDVRLGRLRDMTVHVVGRVAKPGRIRVSSVATLFDALGAAGGVSKDGTLRRILLRRTGREDRGIDLYDYLLEGNVEVDVQLAPSGVVIVPAVGPRVAIVGRVLRPAIYEIDEPHISFQALLAMAGGYARLADQEHLQIESASEKRASIRTVDLSQESPERVLLRDGDVALVRSASPKLEQVVYVAGNVAMPGRYAFHEGMRVSDVVTEDVLVEAGFWIRRSLPAAAAVEEGRRAARIGAREPGPKTEAELEKLELAKEEKPEPEVEEPFLEYPEPFLDYALIRRIDPRTQQETRIPFHLGKAIFDRDPRENHQLQSQDTIIIFPRSAFEKPKTVFVTGAVNKPGEHRYFPGMRVLDLVRVAGGLLPEAHLGSAVLTRVTPEQDGASYTHIHVDLQKVLAGEEQANVLLEESDALAVKVVPEFRKAYRVTVEGEVRHPGTYAVVPGERVSDLLRRVGGFTADAYLPAAQFHRESVRRLQQERIEESLRRLETETKLAAQRYTAEAAATGEKVDVQAEQTRIERLIATIRATPAKGRMVIHLRTAVELEGRADDIELADGDRLVIPRRPQEVHVVGAVFNQTALLWEEGLQARDYLRECGGALDTADMDLAYVIRADGTADSAQSARKGYRWDADRGRFARGGLLASELYPGDTLVVPHDVKPQLSVLGLTSTVTQILFQTALSTGVIVALI